MNGDSFLHNPQSLHTATLDRVTYRGNARRSGHQTGDKYSLTNGVECRRYHTLGKTSMAQIQRNVRDMESMNGGALTSSHLLLADPPNKKSNYFAATTDSFFYRTNGSTSGRARDEMDNKPKRPKSTERLLDEVERNECCDFRRDRPRRRAERPVKSSPRNGLAHNYGEEKQRRGQSDKKNPETSDEPVYEVIAPKRESRVERRRDKHSRRPHSAPVLDQPDQPVKESGRKCGHRNRKPAPPPPAYQDPAVAPLPKYRHPATTPTNVLEVENNNKIILKVIYGESVPLREKLFRIYKWIRLSGSTRRIIFLE